MEIRIPNLNWFLNSLPKKPGASNPYLGSVGTDPLKGFMRKKTLNYSVVLRKLEDESMVFAAESHVQQPWTAGNSVERTDEESREFEASDESIGEIERYLLERARKLL